MIEVPESHELDLRNRLHRIVNIERCALDMQPQRVRDLAEEFCHTIRLAQRVSQVSPGAHPSTCHAFAFDLLTTPQLVTPDGHPVVPSAQFVAHMIEHHLCESDVPAEGYVVVYFDGESIEHSGRWRSGAVESKWGSGHVWAHDIFETPSSYGCVVRFYSTLDVARHHELWHAFAAQSFAAT